jgi:hypothetical protein
MSRNHIAVCGVILLLLGLLGFVSNPLIGQDSLFAANTASNWLHIVAGIVVIAIGKYR